MTSSGELGVLAGTIRLMCDSAQAAMAIEDGSVAGVPICGRQCGAGDALVGDADADGCDLDFEPEHSAGTGRL